MNHIFLILSLYPQILNTSGIEIQLPLISEEALADMAENVVLLDGNDVLTELNEAIKTTRAMLEADNELTMEVST